MISLEMLLKAPPALWVTGAVLVALFISFLIWFFAPGILLRIKLGKLLRQLRGGKARTERDLRALFEGDAKLRHLWKEFRDTLHAQTEERDGQTLTKALRATTPAETFFNAQYIVDSRLRSEFFKHLPGLFTGIGIIGTFLGLITGLQQFKVSEDAGKVRESLEHLLGGVFEAFLVSAAAITLAMLVTFIEKVLLASLYRCTEDIAHHLDSLFAAGAGEEYLSRLVSASEDSASQAKILKDALVGDLKVMLQDMTDRQIQAQAVSSKEFASEIAQGIRAGLQEPFEKIGELVSKASGDQSAVASDLLKDVMASFSERLNELFGGQISGIQELNQRSAQSMQDAVASLNQLVARLEESGQKSGDAMSQRMAQAVEDIERRQASMNEQTQAVVESIRQLVSASQSETNTMMNEAVSQLGQQVAAMVGALQTQAAASHESQQLREQSVTERTTAMISSLEDSLDEVAKQLAQASAQMQQSVAALERTTTASIDKMNSGARTLEQGSVAFAKAGEKVTETLSQASNVAGKMAEVSGSLTSSSSALQAVVVDYRSNREATGSMLEQVRSVVEAAKREAGMTQQVLERIQAAADKLAVVQRDSETYLDGVSAVLVKSQVAFQDGLQRTLDRANSEFHTKLSTAINLLGNTIEELDASLAGFDPDRRR